MGNLQGVPDWYNPYVLSRGSDQADFGDSNGLIYSKIVGADKLLLGYNLMTSHTAGYSLVDNTMNRGESSTKLNAIHHVRFPFFQGDSIMIGVLKCSHM
jgi:hypothetical protein